MSENEHGLCLVQDDGAHTDVDRIEGESDHVTYNTGSHHAALSDTAWANFLSLTPAGTGTRMDQPFPPRFRSLRNMVTHCYTDRMFGKRNDIALRKSHDENCMRSRHAGGWRLMRPPASDSSLAQGCKGNALEGKKRVTSRQTWGHQKDPNP